MKILYDNWDNDPERIIKNLSCLMQACESKEVPQQQVIAYLDRMIRDLKRDNVESLDFNKPIFYSISSMFESISARYNADHLYHILIWNSTIDFSITNYLRNVSKEQIQKQIELMLIRFQFSEFD